MPEMKKIRFALIGCGRIGERHAEQILNYGQLVAVCDINPEKAETFSRKYNCKAFTDLKELLTSDLQFDIVSVCTPNGLHAEHTIEALRAGNHVLCEKPMAIHVVDGNKMINEAERMNRRLFIVKQNRFNPPVAAVKKAIDEGRLGKIYSVQLSCFWNRDKEYYLDSEWKGTKALDGGTLYTQFSHFVDLLFWLFGDIRTVYPITANLGHKDVIEFEDTGVVAFEFYSGALGTINYSVNSYKKNMEGSLTVFGEKGTVKIGGQYLNELEYQCIEDFKITDLPKGNPANFYGQYSGSMSNHNMVYKNVIDVMQNNAVIATNGFEGLKTVEIIDKIYSKSLLLKDSRS